MTDEAASSPQPFPGRTPSPGAHAAGPAGSDDGTTWTEGSAPPSPGLSPRPPAEAAGPGAQGSAAPRRVIRVGSVTDAAGRQLPELDELVERRRLESRGSEETRAAEVLRIVGNAGGFLPLESVLAQGGPRWTLARLLDEHETDKRRRPRLRVGFVDGSPVVWLTATGWQAVGRPSGREVVPDRMTVQEATAPLRIRDYLRALPLEPYGVSVELTTGRSVRDYSAEVVAAAWARLRFAADSGGSLGSLTGGLLPDGLVLERWSGPEAPTLYRQAWGVEPSPDDLAETTVALEVETTDKRERLRGKVDRLSAVVEDLGLARAVVWVVGTREVRDRLGLLGVGDLRRRPGHYLVPAVRLGLPGESLDLDGPVWWPLRVATGPGTDSPDRS